MSLISYFKKYDIQFDDDITTDNYYDYIHPTFIDDSINIKHQRNQYKLHIEDWFNTPVYNMYGVITKDSESKSESIYDDSDNDNDDEYYKYNDIVNRFLLEIHKEYHSSYTYSDTQILKQYECDTYYKGKIYKKQNTLYNRDVCSKIYNDILETILDSGYSIIDLNQFKEDIIYFIYRLSKLD